MERDTICFIVVAGVCGIIAAYSFLRYKVDDDELFEAFAIVFVFFASMGIVCAVVSEKVSKKDRVTEQKQEALLEEAIKNDYPILLDGREVDAEDIDFSFYTIKVDIKKKKIFCTRKVTED